MNEPTRFLGTVEKVQTMADGAIRVTLDLPAASEAEAAVLMSYRRLQIVGQFTVVPSSSLTDLDDETTEEPERSRPILDRRRTANRRDQ